MTDPMTPKPTFPRPYNPQDPEHVALWESYLRTPEGKACLQPTPVAPESHTPTPDPPAPVGGHQASVAPLTVDDMLGLLERAVENADDYHPVSWRVGGEGIECCWRLRKCEGQWELRNALTGKALTRGTLRDLLVAQKARGLLG